uniref:Uncharacterized protein n=1 Tax=Streptomyces sp. NBC_00049 TaxID=2903617 RepID=A0AAU2JY87_9ACTN
MAGHTFRIRTRRRLLVDVPAVFEGLGPVRAIGRTAHGLTSAVVCLDSQPGADQTPPSK